MNGIYQTSLLVTDNAKARVTLGVLHRLNRLFGFSKVGKH